MTERQDFFRHLFEQSQAVIAAYPITVQAAGMDQVTGVLEPAVAEGIRARPFQHLVPPAAREDDDAVSRPAGLNTIGMLLDRLSILTMKHWNLIHRSGSEDRARDLVDGQIEELIQALADAQRGQSSVNNKITTRKVDAVINDFGDAYYGLLTTNMLLWESQEILYNHDISTLPCEELRAYIDFFSRGNILRNVYIQASDETYWAVAHP